MTGSAGSHTELLANNAGSRFVMGQADEFDVDASHDIGDITSVTLWHTGEGFGSAWHLEMVTVEQVSTSVRQEVPCSVGLGSTRYHAQYGWGAES